MPSTDPRKREDTVYIHGGQYAGAWKIDKVNQVTYLLVTPDGRRLKAHKSLVHDQPEPESIALGQPYVPAHVYSPGEFARYTGGPNRNVRTGDVFVVIADKGERVNCATPGGDDGRYWRWPRALITPVSAADVVQQSVMADHVHTAR